MRWCRCAEAHHRAVGERPATTGTGRVWRLSGHRAGDRSHRCGGNGVAGRRATCDRVVVPGPTIPGPRCVTGFVEPVFSAWQSIRAGTGGRQPGGGRGSVAGSRLGGLGGSPTRAISGRGFRPPGGGRKVVFTTGAAVYVIAYCAFAVGSDNALAVALAFAAAGAGIGFAGPTESAVVAQLLPDRLRGSGFGVLGAVQATGDLVATVVAGLLYTLTSPAVAFGYAAAWMVAAAIASGALRPVQ
jgi:hypothetical protein